MSLRIIGGELRNRTLKSPRNQKTRPTLAILRKAVFDIAQNKLIDAQFLDLFAGSGVMGIEALSRGASHVTFIDRDPAAIRCVQENLKLFSLQEKADVFCLDALAALHKCAKKKKPFSLIYIDPPYALSKTTSLLSELLCYIDTHELLLAEGILFVEEGAPATLPQKLPPLSHLRYVNSRQFSDSLLHQFVVGRPVTMLTTGPNFNSSNTIV